MTWTNPLLIAANGNDHINIWKTPLSLPKLVSIFSMFLISLIYYIGFRGKKNIGPSFLAPFSLKIRINIFNVSISHLSINIYYHYIRFRSQKNQWWNFFYPDPPFSLKIRVKFVNVFYLTFLLIFLQTIGFRSPKTIGPIFWPPCPPKLGVIMFNVYYLTYLLIYIL